MYLYRQSEDLWIEKDHNSFHGVGSKGVTILETTILRNNSPLFYFFNCFFVFWVFPFSDHPLIHHSSIHPLIHLFVNTSINSFTRSFTQLPTLPELISPLRSSSCIITDDNIAINTVHHLHRLLLSTCCILKYSLIIIIIIIVVVVVVIVVAIIIIIILIVVIVIIISGDILNSTERSDAMLE